MTDTKTTAIDIPEVDPMDELNIETWYRAGNAEVEPIDPGEAQREIILRILQATTKDAILAPVTTTPAEDVLGQTLLIRGYRRLPSTKADSALRFYLLIDAVDGNGEVLNVTCGSANVIARLAALRAHGFLPLYGAIIQTGKPTAAGYYPMDFEGRSEKDMAPPTPGKGEDF